LVASVSRLTPGGNYVLQSTTNLATGIWVTETNFVATQSSVAITNTVGASAQKFYRIVGH
jgi:hypothetical protein